MSETKLEMEVSNKAEIVQSTTIEPTPIKSLMRLLFLVLVVFSSVICSSVPVKKKSSDPWLDVSLKEDIGMRHPKL